MAFARIFVVAGERVASVSCIKSAAICQNVDDLEELVQIFVLFSRKFMSFLN